MSPRMRSLLRFAVSASLWFAAWSCLVVSLTKEHQPWPWGGVAIYLAVVAMTATLWWMVEIVAHRAIRQIRGDLDELRDEAIPALVNEVLEHQGITRLDPR